MTVSCVFVNKLWFPGLPALFWIQSGHDIWVGMKTGCGKGDKDMSRDGVTYCPTRQSNHAIIKPKREVHLPFYGR